MIRMPTAMASSQRSRRAYAEIIFLNTKKRRRARRRRYPSRSKLFDRVDLREDLLRVDLFCVGGHHRVDELLHLVAPRERHALELAFLLHLDELRLVLARLDLPAVRPGF